MFHVFVFRLQSMLDVHILHRNSPTETLEQVGLWRETHVLNELLAIKYTTSVLQVCFVVCVCVCVCGR